MSNMLYKTQDIYKDLDKDNKKPTLRLVFYLTLQSVA